MQLQKSTESTLIDANVILRYILNDNEEMAQKAQKVISASAYTLSEVLAEVAYVMTKVYSASRTDVAEYLLNILEDVHVSPYPVMKEAIEIYKESKLDFVDCIIAAYHKVEEVKVFTFDKQLNKLLVRQQ